MDYLILIIWSAINAAFIPESIVTVATGIPGGIWTIDKSESKPSIVDDFIGKPTTGINVWEAITPGKCAAFPAAPIITSVSFSISSKASLYSLLDSELFINRALTPHSL